MHYLKGTIDYGLCDLNDRKSTLVYMIQICGTAVSWRSNKQTCVALSTPEAEYMALASAAQEAIWLQHLVGDLGDKPVNPMVLYEDNQSAKCMAKNPKFHGRTKH